jgi:hypothetical protein
MDPAGLHPPPTKRKKKRSVPDKTTNSHISTHRLMDWRKLNTFNSTIHYLKFQFLRHRKYIYATQFSQLMYRGENWCLLWTKGHKYSGLNAELLHIRSQLPLQHKGLIRVCVCVCFSRLLCSDWSCPCTLWRKSWKWRYSSTHSYPWH